MVSEAEETGHVGEGYQGGDFEPGEEEEKAERGEGMARRRGWALAEHFRPEPVFFSEYQIPLTSFSAAARRSTRLRELGCSFPSPRASVSHLFMESLDLISEDPSQVQSPVI